MGRGPTPRGPTRMTMRRLAAILAADVVGFGRLIGEDEAGTLAALREIRKGIVNPVLAEHGGRIFKLMGDGMLAEFPSAVQALGAAIDIRGALRQRNGELSSGSPIVVRIGVHQAMSLSRAATFSVMGSTSQRGWRHWRSPGESASPRASMRMRRARSRSRLRIWATRASRTLHGRCACIGCQSVHLLLGRKQKL